MNGRLGCPRIFPLTVNSNPSAYFVYSMHGPKLMNHCLASLHLQLLSVRFYIFGASLLKLPSIRLRSAEPDSTPTVDPNRLIAAIPRLHAFLNFAIALPMATFNAVTGFEWGRIITAVILGFRMSFSLPTTPSWDDEWARSEIQFGGYLEKMLRMGGEQKLDSPGQKQSAPAGGAQNMDVLTASKVVLEVVKQKYEKRLAKIERERQRRLAAVAGTSGMDPSMNMAWDPIPLDKSMSGCPMIDGSLEAYFPSWNENLSAANAGLPASAGMESFFASIEGENQPAVPPDLWATLTTGWAQTDTDFSGV